MNNLSIKQIKQMSDDELAHMLMFGSREQYETIVSALFDNHVKTTERNDSND